MRFDHALGAQITQHQDFVFWLIVVIVFLPARQLFATDLDLMQWIVQTALLASLRMKHAGNICQPVRAGVQPWRFVVHGFFVAFNAYSRMAKTSAKPSLVRFGASNS